MSSLNTTLKNSPTTAPSFPKFPLLPPELRQYIYQLALNYHLSLLPPPTLYFFKLGGWRGLSITPLHEDYDHDIYLDENPFLLYHYDHMEFVEWWVPLMGVSWEAREVVRRWAFDEGKKREVEIAYVLNSDASGQSSDSLGLGTQTGGGSESSDNMNTSIVSTEAESSHTIFTTRFSPSTPGSDDILYIPAYEWEAFYEEFQDPQESLDIELKEGFYYFDPTRSKIRFLALDAEMFVEEIEEEVEVNEEDEREEGGQRIKDAIEKLAWIMDNVFGTQLKAIYIMLNPPTESESAPFGPKRNIRPHWEIPEENLAAVWAWDTDSFSFKLKANSPQVSDINQNSSALENEFAQIDLRRDVDSSRAASNSEGGERRQLSEAQKKILEAVIGNEKLKEVLMWRDWYVRGMEIRAGWVVRRGMGGGC